MICGHCSHQTNLEAGDRMMVADYRDALIATDHSRLAVMGHLMNHLCGNIEKEIQWWMFNESTKRKNALRPRLQEDTEAYYTHRWKKIT